MENSDELKKIIEKYNISEEDKEKFINDMVEYKKLKENKDKMTKYKRDYQNVYYKKHTEQMKEKQKRYHDKIKDQISIKKKEYYQLNKEKIQERRKINKEKKKNINQLDITKI